MMKRIIAMALCLVLALSLISAAAEGAAFPANNLSP